MTAARRAQEKPGPSESHRSGEHTIELDRLVRKAFENVFEADLQATSQISRFELEEVLSHPEAKPSEPPAATPIVGVPIVNVGAEGVTLDSLPPPAIEIDRTKEEKRDP